MSGQQQSPPSGPPAYWFGSAASCDAVTVGSLCSGYTGLDAGLSLALGVPLRHAWHVEYDGINKKGELTGPRKILAHRFPDVPNYGDVKLAPWHDMEPVDWLTAGYPCQPFSLAGLRKGADDPRHLWPGVARAISVLRPRNVLLENVAAHLRDGADVVLADLTDMGYVGRFGVVRASDAGAPHGRARLFIAAADARGEAVGQRPGLRACDPTRIGRGRPDHNRPQDAPADAAGDGRGEGRTQSAGVIGRPDAAQRRDAAAHADRPGGEARDGRPGTGDARRLQPVVDGDATGDVPADSDSAGPQGSEPARGLDLPAWGAYEPAIRRWEHVTGRPAPRPTEPARNGQRLSPRFVEWLMGLPAGWVTDVPGLPRNAQLKALGNGVVPQQAALAVRLLLPTACEVAA